MGQQSLLQQVHDRENAGLINVGEIGAGASFEQVLTEERVFPATVEFHVDERIFFLEDGLQSFGIRGIGGHVNNHFAFLLCILQKLAPIHGLALGVRPSDHGKTHINSEHE